MNFSSFGSHVLSLWVSSSWSICVRNNLSKSRISGKTTVTTNSMTVKRRKWLNTREGGTEFSLGQFITFCCTKLHFTLLYTVIDVAIITFSLLIHRWHCITFSKLLRIRRLFCCFIEGSKCNIEGLLRRYTFSRITQSSNLLLLFCWWEVITSCFGCSSLEDGLDRCMFSSL